MHAHIGGLPVEEIVALFAPFGLVSVLVAVSQTRQRSRDWVSRLARVRDRGARPGR